MVRHKMVLSIGSIVAVLVLAAQAGAYYSADDLMPPPELKQPLGEGVMYANGVMARNTQLTNPTVPLPAPRDSFVIDSFFDIFTEVSLDGGLSWMPIHTSGHGVIQYNLVYMDPLARLYDTEMLALDIEGGELPPGVMIRESPTMLSHGWTDIFALDGGGGGGGYQIDSFFDVFTELSFDGGQTWAPSQTPLHLIGSPEPATLSLLALGGLAMALRRRS